jgi:hypothetical protein
MGLKRSSKDWSLAEGMGDVGSRIEMPTEKEVRRFDVTRQ